MNCDDHKGRFEINSREDLIQHYKYGNGNTVPAGPKLLKQIRRSHELEFIFHLKRTDPSFLDDPFPNEYILAEPLKEISTPKDCVLECYCDILGIVEIHLDMHAFCYWQKRTIFKTHVYGYKEINFQDDKLHANMKGTPFLVKIDFTFNVGNTPSYKDKRPLLTSKLDFAFLY